MSDTRAPTLLICSVGGAAPSLVASLAEWTPSKTCFVHTRETHGTIATVRALAAEKGVVFDDGYDTLEIADGDSLLPCIDAVRQLGPSVEAWTKRSDAHRVVVDYTSGTKNMSIALALHARRWPCIFSYVSGERRTQHGIGVPEAGTEKVVHHDNPWDAFGYQAVDDFVSLFDQGAYAAAANLMAHVKKQMSDPVRKREIQTLDRLATAFDAWDRFQHEEARRSIDDVSKGLNDLRAIFGPAKADALVAELRRLERRLPPSAADAAGEHLIADLVANAKRCRDAGRFDDAMARLYRVVEAAAQRALRESHGFDSTESVPLQRVPESLRAAWQERARDGCVAIGLQDAYALLDALGDELGARFRDARLDDSRRSPLIERNRSILAHGFQPVSSKTVDVLWSAVLALTKTSEADIPSFPRLRALSTTSAS